MSPEETRVVLAGRNLDARCLKRGYEFVAVGSEDPNVDAAVGSQLSSLSIASEANFERSIERLTHADDLFELDPQRQPHPESAEDPSRPRRIDGDPVLFERHLRERPGKTQIADCGSATKIRLG
jgi:hypothetical protein